MLDDLNFTFTLEYNNLDVEKSDLDQPLVRLNYKLRTESNMNVSGLYVDIQSIKYRVTIQSSDSNSSSFLTELSFGEFYSPKPIFVKIGTVQDVFFYFNLSTKAVGKIIDISTKGRVVVLQIPVEIYGKVYRLQQDRYLTLDNIVYGITEHIKHGNHLRIVMPNQDVQRLIKDAEYAQKLRIDILLYNYNPSVNPLIKSAVNSLQSAAEEFEKGNVRGVLIETRNAVTNHLTDVVDKKRVLKSQLRDGFLAQAPTDADNIYKNVIDNLQDELLSVLEIIHKFIHEDSDKLRMIPMREDLELTYYSVALIISYLARRLSIG